MLLSQNCLFLYDHRRPPPISPILPSSEQALTLRHVQQFFEMLKTVQAIQALQPPGEALQPVKTEDTSGDKQQVPAWASKLEWPFPFLSMLACTFLRLSSFCLHPSIKLLADEMYYFVIEDSFHQSAFLACVAAPMRNHDHNVIENIFV